MAVVPGEVIAAPEPLRRRYGLLTAASGPLDLPGHGRGGGVRFVPVTCGTAHAYPIDCENGSVVVPEGGKPSDPENAEFEALPFMVLATLECGVGGYTGAELEAKVRRRLENGEQGTVERALWTGEDFQGNPLGIANLSTGADDIPVLDDDMITGVVAGLEEYAYTDQGYGYTAYIHAPVGVAAYAAEAGLVIPDGPLKVTPYGSVWIFGGGYPGTGDAGDPPPAGGWNLHITGQVQVWRSPDVFTYPADQTLDRSNNQRLLVAEREYAVSFDCLNGRAEFNPMGSS